MKKLSAVLSLLFVLGGCVNETEVIENEEIEETKPVENSDPKSLIDLSLNPNESGEIMVLMYHSILENEDVWVRSIDHFKKDLETLYSLGFRPISLMDYVSGNILMIANALIDLGYQAQVNGRNDIEVSGYKVSGNAFAHQGNTHLHHGTLLVNVDKTLLGKYLNVNPKKLQRKNVSSVAARIENLKNIKDLSIDSLINHLFKAVEEYAGVKGERLSSEAFKDQNIIDAYSDEHYRLGLKKLDRFKFEDCFDFGCIKWDFEAQEGKIVFSKIYSDALENEWIERLEKSVLGHLEKNLKQAIANFDSEFNDRRDALLAAME